MALWNSSCCENSSVHVVRTILFLAHLIQSAIENNHTFHSSFPAFVLVSSPERPKFSSCAPLSFNADHFVKNYFFYFKIFHR